MAALELAQTTLASPQVSKTFLNQLVEKEFLTEEARDGILADEDLCQFITTGKKARKKSTKKQSPSDEERNKEQYDPSRCPCRIWKATNGIGLPNVQCSKKLPGGESMCKMHSGKIGDGKWWLGFVNEEPPEEPMFCDHLKNPNKAHWWTSEAKEAAESKKKAEKVKKKKVESEEEDDGEEEPKEVKKKVKKVKKKKVDSEEVKKEPEEEEEEEEEPKEVKKEKVKKVESEEEDDGEEEPKEVKKKVKKEKVKKEKVKKEKVKKEKVKKEPEEEEEDDGAGTGLKFDQDLSEDESEEKDFVFEGVTYKKTPEGEIIDHEYNYIGDDDGEGGITFTDDDALERHEENKASL